MVIGWDIGGVNTKAARVAHGEVQAVRARPFELQRAPDTLVSLLRELASEVGADSCAAHGVTMTAELSQMFRTKREGVAFVLDAVETAFPLCLVRVFAVDGRFLAPDEGRQDALAVAAANWAATAHVVAERHPDALLVDTGTTSTDIIPIVDGAVVAEGRTDPERLASGELVYTGAVRTPAEAMASHVPVGGTLTGVSAEGFALAGDVHLWRGDLAPADYTSPTPDGRPATRAFAGERLARVICADRDLLDEAAVSAIAAALAEAQVARITAAIRRVRARHRSLRVAVITGVGAFLGDAAARAAGLQVVPLATQLGGAAARCAPAASVALLLERALAGGRVVRPNRLDIPASVAEGPRRGRSSLSRERVSEKGVRPLFGSHPAARATALVNTVVKLGGGLLADVEHLDMVLAAIAAAARTRRLLVVPGGGPFADAVRAVDRRLGLSDAAAHWMAVLAMDQYAHLIVARVGGGVLVADPQEIAAALDAGDLPVLAPSRWLREADPLPHTWDVTSDSIAAWVAGEVGASRLVLVKPSGAAGCDVVDDYFDRALPKTVTTVIVPADRADALRSVLHAE